MSDPTPALPTAPGAAQIMVRMLSCLARKGAHLVANEAGFDVVMPGAQQRHRGETVRRFPQDVVEAAARQGWLVGDGTRYRLTEAGALALHRGLKPAGPADISPVAIRPSNTAPIRPRAQRRPATVPSHQMEAAERLAEDFQTGQMMPRVTSNWDRASLGALPGASGNPSGRGVDVSERISAAQERVRRALADAGPEFTDVLIDLCCFETGVEVFESKRGWPRRSAKLVLGLALDRLARHYGIVGQGPRHGRTQHRGESGYRPT